MSSIPKRGPLLAVPSLGLSRLFGGASEHPVYNEAGVQEMIAALPADPLAGMTDLVRHAVSINQTDLLDFEQRTRVLMALDAAAHDRWARICADQFAPNAAPSEGREPNAMALRSLLEIATGFANSYALNLRNEALESGWVRKHLAEITLRRALWLARKFVFVNALRHPNAASTWREAHALYLQARGRGLLETAVPAPDGGSTSIQQEYVRLFLMDIAGPDTLSGRALELVSRIARQVAASARLEPRPLPAALYAVVPDGASRPVSVRRLPKSATALYLDASGCLAPLQALIDRNPDHEPADPDPSFDRQFTMQETRDMAHRLMEHWGPNPPKRRSQRVALDAPIRLRCGFDSIVAAMLALDQGVPMLAAAAQALRSEADKDPRSDAAKAARETQARLADASAAGLGILVPRKDALWARLETLLAVYMEPGPDWIVGVLRRISAEGDMLRLGVRILARRPRCGWFHPGSSRQTAARSHEERGDQEFLQFYRRGILLDVDLESAAAGEILVPHGVLKPDARLEFPLESRVQHVAAASMCEQTRGFDRVAFEARGATPYVTQAKAEEKEEAADVWKWAD